jgi:hypothetical protein
VPQGAPFLPLFFLAFFPLPDYTLGMLETGKNSIIMRKSYEISYALWRIAANSSEKVFAGKLSDKAIELVSAAADGDRKALTSVLNSLEMIVKFAIDVNILTVSNGVILSREIGNLQAAILPETGFAGIEGLSIVGDVDISDIFSGKDEENIKSEEDDEDDIDFGSESKVDLGEIGNFAKMIHVEESGSETDSGNKAEIRQATILERIRQFGNCRVGDIQEILPGTSERTIRYDLETLIQKHLIERMGTGGRGVYYRAVSQNGVSDDVG